MWTPWMRLTVCDDNRVAIFNGFIGNGCSEVNGEEDRVGLYPGFVERSFQKHLELNEVSTLQTPIK